MSNKNFGSILGESVKGVVIDEVALISNSNIDYFTLEEKVLSNVIKIKTPNNRHIFKWIVLSESSIELTCILHKNPNCLKNYFLNLK